MSSKKLLDNKFYKIILYFFIYAFLGWALETLYAIYDVGYFYKRGFLYGPICPIYGYGAFILILFFCNYKKNSFKLFIYAGFIFSAFEYFVSYFLDACFKIKCWDYSNKFFNLNGRISIFFSIIWGIIAILFVNKVHPFIEKNVNKILDYIPIKLQNLLLYTFVFIFITDTILSCIKYLNLG